jgi:hypothetical protein
MGWVLRLVETEGDGPARWIDVMEISRFRDVDDIANLGLSLAEGKLLQARATSGRRRAGQVSHGHAAGLFRLRRRVSYQ